MVGTTWTSTSTSGNTGFTVTFRVGVPVSLRQMQLRTLELPPTATYEDAKNAYRRLVKEHHPDRGGDRERFERIHAAWEMLRGDEW